MAGFYKYNTVGTFFSTILSYVISASSLTVVTLSFQILMLLIISQDGSIFIGKMSF